MDKVQVSLKVKRLAFLMANVPVSFMLVVGGAVLLLFGGGIYEAARYTLWIEGHPRPNDMPGIVSYFVTAVNGALAANLGVLLGLSISHGVRRSPPNASDLFPWLAAVWYVAMLLLATAFWGMADFTDDGSKVVSLLPEMTKNAIGIFVAILAAVLGVHTREKAILERDDGHGSAKPSGGPDSAG